MQKLEFHEVIFTCDRESVCNIVQEEAGSLRHTSTIVENSGVGDSEAVRVIEKQVQALGQQVRNLKGAEEIRSGVNMKGTIVVVTRLAGHAADVLS